METELQTLRREVDELRNENIVLHNELVKQNKILFEQVISIGKELANQQKNLHQAVDFYGGGLGFHDSLRIHLKRLAGRQTAKFIVQNMVEIKSFQDRIEHLKHAVTQAYMIRGGVF